MRGLHPELPGRIGHGRPMIAARRGRDARGRYLLGQERVEGAPRLERPGMLQEFELQADWAVMAERARQGPDRRAADMRGDAGMSGFDGGAGDRRDRGHAQGPDRKRGRQEGKVRESLGGSVLRSSRGRSQDQDPADRTFCSDLSHACPTASPFRADPIGRTVSSAHIRVNAERNRMTAIRPRRSVLYMPARTPARSTRPEPFRPTP